MYSQIADITEGKRGLLRFAKMTARNGNNATPWISIIIKLSQANGIFQSDLVFRLKINSTCTLSTVNYFWYFSQAWFQLKNSGKGQTQAKQFFRADISPKQRTNEFYSTTMKPQIHLFSLPFWRKLKTSKRHFEAGVHFEIIWPIFFVNSHPLWIVWAEI